jgi:UDP-2,3-diacylglucosamine pyrophosphatase LpxH
MPKTQVTKYKTICISDTHLGAKEAKAGILSDFLKHHACDNLFLVGDIIDGWKIQQNKWRWKPSHTRVIRQILNYSKSGTKVVYVTGNHDEFIRPFVSHIALGNISICNQAEYRDIDGNRLLITHGDLFDGITRLAPWLGFLGDKAYDSVLWMNNHFNVARHRMGFGYWSLSKYLKHKVKKAIDFVFKFEENLTTYAAKRGFDGVICGHIHTAEIKLVNGIIYMNDGDWVESCSALVEHYDGRWEIIYWTKGKEDVDVVDSGSEHK